MLKFKDGKIPDDVDKWLYDNIMAIGTWKDQGIKVFSAYLKAYNTTVDWVKKDCDKYLAAWLAGDPTATTIHMLDSFEALYKQGHDNIPGPTPEPGEWILPATPGLHPVLSRPGGFFMDGMLDANNGDLILCTYMFNGQSYLLRWDGKTFTTELALPTESVYMPKMTPEGKILCSTEKPAQIFLGYDAKYDRVMNRPEPTSLAFEFQDLQGDLVVFTCAEAWRDYGIQMYRGPVSGKSWGKWGPEFNGKLFLNSCSDGNNAYLCGHEKDNGIGYPVIYNMSGDRVLRMGQYAKQQISYLLKRDNLWTLGLQNITEWTDENERRNAYLNSYNGANTQDALLRIYPPWPMHIDMDPLTKIRYALCSVWNETGYPRAVLLHAKDGRDWKLLTSLNMSTALSMIFVPGKGVIVVGGEYNQKGVVEYFAF